VSDGSRREAPVFSLTLAGSGIALSLLGVAYGSGCNFDTMSVCHPFGLLTASSWDVSATAGALLVGGGLLALCGAAGVFFQWLRGLLAPLPDA
jgi:hypothetical protein